MRNYKKKTNDGFQDIETLLKAVKEVKIEKKSMYSVSIRYNIKKISFQNYIHKIDEHFPDISKISDDELSHKLTEIITSGKPTVSLKHSFAAH